MPVSFVQKTDGNVAGTGTSQATVWGGNPANGNCVIVCVFWKTNVTITSVTDSQGNTYADCGAGRLSRPTDGFLQILGANNITGGATPTVTVNFSGGGGTEIDVYLLEYAGQNPSTLFDSVTSTGTATSGTTVTTGSFTPTVSVGAVFAFGDTDDTNGSAGASMTSRSAPAGAGVVIEDRIFNASLGSITASVTMSAAITKGALIACTIRGIASDPGWTVGTLGLPFQGPRDALGFLRQPVYSYVETPPTVVAAFVVPVIKVSKPKKRRARPGLVKLILAPHAPPAAPQTRRKTATLALQKKRRARGGAVTLLIALTTQLTARAPTESQTLVQAKKSRKRKGKTTLVTGARRATAAAPTQKPRSPLVVSSAKKSRRRKGKTTLVTGARRATTKPHVPVVVGQKKRRKGKGRTTLVTGARRAPVVAAVKPRKPQTAVLVRKSPRRAGGVTLLFALTTQLTTRVPTKPQTVIQRKKRQGAKGKTQLVTGARRQTGAAPAGRPRKSITVKLAPKRRKGSARAKLTVLKKRRTPYITGVTRNSAGTPIGSCNVFVFRTADEVLVAQGVSDSVTGIYLLPVPSYTDNLFVVAYRADAPDIFGTTVNWLTGA